MMSWERGPKRLGCVYHQRAVRRADGDSIVVDVFIMPRIARRRPIAITIGRYRNYKAVVKAEWQLRQPEEVASAGQQLAALFAKVGASEALATEFIADVREFILRESATLRKTLAALPKPAA